MLVDALELLVKALERVLEVHRIHGMHGLLPELLQQLGERLRHQAPTPHHVVLVQLRLKRENGQPTIFANSFVRKSFARSGTCDKHYIISAARGITDLQSGIHVAGVSYVPEPISSSGDGRFRRRMLLGFPLHRIALGRDSVLFFTCRCFHSKWDEK